MTFLPRRTPLQPAVYDLALELWAVLDTEISAPGTLKHEEVVPLIEKFLRDKTRELRGL